MSPTHEAEILRAARAIARLQLQARKLRKELKLLQKEISIERKLMRALSLARVPQSAPSRLFGDGVGHTLKPNPNAPITLTGNLRDGLRMEEEEEKENAK